MMTKAEEKGGFTLVEIIVALGIFVSAVTVAIGSLLVLYNANNKSQSLSSVMNNLSFSVEEMVRTIRFATDYHCGNTNPSSGHSNPRDCSTGDTFLAVTDSNGDLIRYRLQSGKIEKSVNSNSSSAYTPITSSEVNITYLKFYVLNTVPASLSPNSGSSEQPYVVLIVRGHAGAKPSAQSTFDIETLVSQRKLDL